MIIPTLPMIPLGNVKQISCNTPDMTASESDYLNTHPPVLSTVKTWGFCINIYGTGFHLYIFPITVVRNLTR